MGFKIAVRSFSYHYTGVDALYDQVYCYDNFDANRNLSDCYITEHSLGQQCESNTTLGLVCSDG